MKILLIIILHFSLLISANNGSNVPSIYVFGDSIFDAGNNHYNKNCTAQADFPPYGSTFFHRPTGRFTNGRTVADFILLTGEYYAPNTPWLYMRLNFDGWEIAAQFIGFPFQQPFLEVQEEIKNGSIKGYPSNGLNFASAGSGVLRATNLDLGVTPIQVQLEQFRTLVEDRHISKFVIQQSLFLLESGSNDIFTYFDPVSTPTLTPDAYVRSMSMEVGKFIDQICKLGARRIAIFSLGPVGCVPARVLLPGTAVTKCYGKMNKMVKNYNKVLEGLVNGVPIKYPGAFGVFGEVYKTVQDFRANPRRYGFANVTDACCGDGTLGGFLQCGKEGYTVCKNPNEYLFWDFFHPSERTYKLIAKALWAGGHTRIRPLNLKKFANMTLPH